VRVLLGCSLGGEGHLVPLTTVGRAINRAGHEVVVVVPPAMAASAQRTGLSYRVGDEPPLAFVEEIWQRVRAGPADAVAEAQVGISLASLESGVRKMVAPIIDGFAPGVAAAIGAAPYLSSFPASLDPSDWPDTRRFRPTATTAQPDTRESWWGDGAAGPLVYVTFGSVLGHLSEAIATYRCALDAVAGLPVRVLMTVGRATEVASLGFIPENTRVEQWVPQDAVLRRADLVVCHGGSGTTFGALGAGVPVVICPLFADQSRNARMVHDAGAGVVLSSENEAAGGLLGLGPADVPGLRQRIEEVLREPRYRDGARRIGVEMSSMPGLDEMVERLTQRL